MSGCWHGTIGTFASSSKRSISAPMRGAAARRASSTAGGSDAVEAALLIFPEEPADGEESARAFEAFGAALREQMFAAHPGQAPFYCVAFHPDLPRDLLDASRAVRFIRRSPDPTLQFVRASILIGVRGEDGGGSRDVDTR